MALGQVFGLKRDELREWRRMHNEELHDLYFSPNIIRLTFKKKKGWHIARTGLRCARKVLVRKSEENRPLLRPMSRYDIKMDLQIVECLGMDWIDLLQDR